MQAEKQEGDDDNSNVIKFDFMGDQDNGIMDFGGPYDDENTQKLKTDKYKRIQYGDWPDKEPSASNEEELIYQEEIDDFPDYKFTVVWQQKCWDILYRLYYDVDSGPFLSDISEEAMGAEFY